MPTIKYREESRKNYGVIKASEESQTLTEAQLTLGAVLRIADATELMATNFTTLQDRCNYLVNERDRYKERYNKESMKNRTLRGHITRLKNEIERLKNGDNHTHNENDI